MLSIGTFSRATHVSIRALRRYHEQGLLVPAEVDRGTGYRTYRQEQILDAQLIRRLRDLDLPLSEVAQIIEARDPVLTATILTGHRGVLQERRAEVDRSLSELAGLLDGSRRLSTGPVYERPQRPDAVVLVRGRTPESWFEQYFAAAFERLHQHIEAIGLVPGGPGGARFPDRHWDSGGVAVEVFVPVDTAVAGRGVEAGRLPAGRLAAVLHAGGYDGIDDAHAALGGWASAAGVEPAGCLQELYLTGPGDTGDPLRWRTEVGWLISPEPSKETL